MVLTRLAVVLATSLADCTNCLRATGLEVLEEARRQALQRAEVCLATIVAADRTWCTNEDPQILNSTVVNEALQRVDVGVNINSFELNELFN